VAKQVSGRLFIVAAPSGGGKTSLVKRLVQDMEDIVVSVSHTTRDMRQGEEHGVHYFFVEEPEFLERAAQGEFIEHARVFEYLYGTSKAPIETQLAQGVDVVLDIDWQGAQQMKQAFPEAVTVFIVPPSVDVLKQRLMNRRRDHVDEIDSRMRRAYDELSHYDEFDYLIVNEDFDKASTELRAIVASDRLRADRQIKNQKELLSFLLASK
jgi:guanylate kinase